MRAQITDSSVFSSVDPNALFSYLLANGWTEVRRIENELITLRKLNQNGKSYLVWAPMSDEYVDYVPMVAKAIRVISEAENKSEIQLLDDIETAAVGDVLELKTYDVLNVHSHTLPLADGIDLLNKARRLAVAGASSAIDKKPVHARRPYQRVSSFVEKLRLGQTERGSYLVRLISPVQRTLSEGSSQPVLNDTLQAPPFSRRAMIGLIQGLKALKDVAESNQRKRQFQFNEYLEAVSRGVSANLCEAILYTEETGEAYRHPLEVGITWSYALPGDETLPSELIRFEPPLFPYITEAAEEFRRRNPEYVVLEGYVKILERDVENSDGSGSIRLITTIDGSSRTVRMQLGPEDYDLAIEAHKEGSLVSVAGILEVRGVFRRLQNPTGFQIIEPMSSMFDDDDF